MRQLPLVDCKALAKLKRIRGLTVEALLMSWTSISLTSCAYAQLSPSGHGKPSCSADGPYHIKCDAFADRVRQSKRCHAVSKLSTN